MTNKTRGGKLMLMACGRKLLKKRMMTQASLTTLPTKPTTAIRSLKRKPRRLRAVRAPRLPSQRLVWRTPHRRVSRPQRRNPARRRWAAPVSRRTLPRRRSQVIRRVLVHISRTHPLAASSARARSRSSAAASFRACGGKRNPSWSQASRRPPVTALGACDATHRTSQATRLP